MLANHEQYQSRWSQAQVDYDWHCCPLWLIVKEAIDESEYADTDERRAAVERLQYEMENPYALFMSKDQVRIRLESIFSKEEAESILLMADQRENQLCELADFSSPPPKRPADLPADSPGRRVSPRADPDSNEPSPASCASDKSAYQPMSPLQAEAGPAATVLVERLQHHPHEQPPESGPQTPPLSVPECAQPSLSGQSQLATNPQPQPVPQKRPRGRPRKYPLASQNAVAAPANGQPLKARGGMGSALSRSSSVCSVNQKMLSISLNDSSQQDSNYHTDEYWAQLSEMRRKYMGPLVATDKLLTQLASKKADDPRLKLLLAKQDSLRSMIEGLGQVRSDPRYKDKIYSKADIERLMKNSCAIHKFVTNVPKVLKPQPKLETNKDTNEYWVQLGKVRAEHMEALKSFDKTLTQLANKQANHPRVTALLAKQQSLRKVIEALSQDRSDPQNSNKLYTPADMERLAKNAASIRMFVSKMRDVLQEQFGVSRQASPRSSAEHTPAISRTLSLSVEPDLPDAPSCGLNAHQLHSVNLHSPQGRRIIKLVQRHGFFVKKIERNENRVLERAYQDHKQRLEELAYSASKDELKVMRKVREICGLDEGELPPYNANEALLFHKTKDDTACDAILENGFSVCYSNAGSRMCFGKGIYFTDDIRKSHSYGPGSNTVLLCRVVLGDCVDVRSTISIGAKNSPISMWDRKTAPQRSDCYKRYPGNSYYDSWYGRQDFHEYVLSSGQQILPLYLITYEREMASAPCDDMPEKLRPMAKVPKFILGRSAIVTPIPEESDEQEPWQNSLDSEELDEEISLHSRCIRERKECEACGSSEDEKLRHHLLRLADAKHPVPMDSCGHQNPCHFVASTVDDNAQYDFHCPICLDPFCSGREVVDLKCCSNAVFHKSCFHQIVKSSKTMSGRPTLGVRCPMCKASHGEVVGSCPDGSMNTAKIRCSDSGDEFWQITFSFAAGFSPEGHMYPGRTQQAYLPCVPEAEDLLVKLRHAFDLRHCFRLGISDTNNRFGITFGDLHYKTSMTGGMQMYGFPDPGYLTRLRRELKQVLGK